MRHAKTLIDIFNHSSNNEHAKMIRSIDRAVNAGIPTAVINKVLALSHRCNEVEQIENTVQNLILTVG